MDRRDTLKSLLVTSLGGGLLVQSCSGEKTDTPAIESNESANTGNGYGRTPNEAARDAKLFSENCYNDQELDTIAALCDIILPSNDSAASAIEAGVPEFIEFISKDLPNHQVPVKGGIMWLDAFANKNHGSQFVKCNRDQQLTIADQIAYPDKAPAELKAGVKFFNLMRNLVLTGYYTSEVGIKDLGYQGNMPNIWDGIPEDVLKQQGLEYEPDWIPKFVDQSKRDVQAEWDEEGNLLT